MTVFFDEWDILPGDVVPHRLDKAIRDSMACVAVVSPALFRSPRAMEEHAALMGRGIRFIPVLIGDAEPPAFTKGRVWRDFRGVEGDDYDEKVDELVDILARREPHREREGAARRTWRRHCRRRRARWSLPSRTASCSATWVRTTTTPCGWCCSCAPPACRCGGWAAWSRATCSSGRSGGG
ncbi:toll/interleukin-1 receptor domain-containing protein [Nonomuraea thailandensis]